MQGHGQQYPTQPPQGIPHGMPAGMPIFNNGNIVHNMQLNPSLYGNKIPMQPNMIVDQNNTIQNNK